MAPPRGSGPGGGAMTQLNRVIPVDVSVRLLTWGSGCCCRCRRCIVSVVMVVVSLFPSWPTSWPNDDLITPKI
jgi:hypothetical protein